MTQTSGLVLDGVEVRYGDLVAVRPVSLEVPVGILVAVTGPSGAGKSSLLWALAGALTPSAGSVSLDDEPIGDRQAASRRGVVLAPQGNALATALTAYENVLVPLLSAGVSASEAAERSTQSLVRVGLEESGNHLVEELSGGQQQRVALARAFAARAVVLLADEPTSDLDATNRERMIGELQSEAARGATVVMSTHDPEAAQEAGAEIAIDEGDVHWARFPGRPPSPHPRHRA